jgi:hypothetical protein
LGNQLVQFPVALDIRRQQAISHPLRPGNSAIGKPVPEFVFADAAGERAVSWLGKVSFQSSSDILDENLADFASRANPTFGKLARLGVADRSERTALAAASAISKRSGTPLMRAIAIIAKDVLPDAMD